MKFSWLHLLIWGYFIKIAHSAYVQTYTCRSARKITKDHENVTPLFDSTSPLAEVLIRDEVILYRLEFVTSMEISDINYTTNSITTLQIESNFLNGVVMFSRNRLCDYVSFVPNVTNETNHDQSSWPDDDIPLSDLLGLAPYNDIGPAGPRSASNSPSSGFPEPPGTEGVQPTPIALPEASATPVVLKRDRDVTAHRESVCPLKPGMRYQILFAANTSSPRYFGSYETRFSILSADQEFGCVQVYATPYHPIFITYPICFGVMAIFIFGFITNFYIFHYSIHQETTNAFLFVASSICNEPLLNELTPDVTMLLNFLQFVLFALALNLNYPGFLQPIASFINWVCLIRIDLYAKAFINPMSWDGVYKSLGMQGLFGIFPETGALPDGLTAANMWKSFFSWFWVTVSFVIVATQIFISIRQFMTSNYKISGYKSRLTNAFGIITQMFYCVFPLPFVAISSFLILCLGKAAPKIELAPSIVCIIFLVVWLIGIGWFSFTYVIRKKEKLYSSFNVISCWCSLYHWYKPECSYFLMIEKFKILFQGMVIGFAQSSGIVQIALLLLAESVYLLALFYIQPFFNKNRNIWSIAVSSASLVIVALNIPLIRELHVANTARGIIGDVQLMIIAICLVGFFSFFVLRLTKVILSRRNYDNDWVHYDQSRKSSLDEDFVNETRGANEKYTNDDTFSFDGYNQRHSGDRPHYYHETQQGLEEQFSFEGASPISSHFPRPRLEYQHSRHDRNNSVNSEKSSVIELTDERALPGLSLSYLGSSDNLPKVSPIDDEYLANLDKKDSEVRKLWAKRTKTKKSSFQRYNTTSTYGNSLLQRIKSSFDQGSRDETSTVNESGFAVVGRKSIQVKNDTIHETE